MNTKKTIITGVIIFVMVILLITGLSYAYFSANISGGEKDTTIVVTGGTMNIHYNGGSDIMANNIIPSNIPFAKKVFTVTGNNTIDIDMYYEVFLVVEKNSFSDNALKYKLIGTNTNNNGSLIDDITELTNIGSMTDILSLGVGGFDVPTNGNKVHTYTLELYFPEVNTNQNIDQGKEFKAHLEIVMAEKPLTLLKEFIIKQGGGFDAIVARGIPDFSMINGSSGIYKTEDEYGDSYYYRGIKEELNNNLIWAGFQWKIVRINGDGSIRLIYNGTEAQFNTNQTVNITGSNTQTTNTSWNLTNINDAKYVGYMYGGANGVASTMRHGTTSVSATYNETSTNMKTTLDNWYKNNILNKGHSDLVADNLFCNDRQFSSEVGGKHVSKGYGSLLTVYAGYHRIQDNKIPTLKCGQRNDRFTVNDTNLGNGSLTYPVGLLSLDEAAMAGLTISINNLSNYLSNNLPFRLFTPVLVDSSGNAFIWSVYSSGILDNRHHASISNGVRPVLSLTSSFQSTGTGSATDPFRIVES